LFQGRKKLSIITANIVLIAIAGLLITLSITTKPGSTSQSRVVALSDDDSSASPMDELSSADIAVHVARVTAMEESNSVANKADTEKAELTLTSSDDKVIAKPQIMAEGLKSRKDIQTYVAKKNDTVGSIANKFNVTSETIRLSNNITGNDVDDGAKLLISPINGIVYTVKAGDSPRSLAAKYRASVDQLIAFNDAEITKSFKPGERIVIPDGLSPISAEFTYSNGDNPTGFAFGTTAQYGNAGGGNGYDFGWCTWHAANRRMEIGRPIPNNLGNAISWLGIARAAGLETGSEPREGAVVYFLNIGGLGHVAFVENVYSDGSFKLSQMNNPYWGKVTYDHVPKSEVGSYRFIY